MYNKSPSYMRMYRKRFFLSQQDVAFLLVDIYSSDLSRIEKGIIAPNVDVLLVCHLLFNTSVESFFTLRSKMIQPMLVQNCKKLMAVIQKDIYKPHLKLNEFKIRSFQEMIERLSEN